MAWISVHETVDGPKLRNLYKILGCSKFEALGILNFFWFWGLQNADKYGLILYADEEDIERYLYGVGAGCGLDCKKVVSALFESGWVDKENDGLYIHDWETWQKEWYKLQERLKQDAERKRNNRSAAKAMKSMESPVDIPKDRAVEIPKTVVPQAVQTPIPTRTVEPAKTEVTKTSKPEYSKDFEEFWEVYPRKVEKAKAASAYNARVKQGWSPAELMIAVRNYASECKRNRTEIKYIKHGATFLSANTPFADYIPKGEQIEAAKPDNSVPDTDFNPFGKFMGD